MARAAEMTKGEYIIGNRVAENNTIRKSTEEGIHILQHKVQCSTWRIITVVEGMMDMIIQDYTRISDYGARISTPVRVPYRRSV